MRSIKHFSITALIIIGLGIFNQASARTLKECLHKCHQHSSLSLKDVRACKDKCQQLAKKKHELRKSRKQKAGAPMVAVTVAPAVEIEVPVQEGDQIPVEAPVISQDPATLVAPDGQESETETP